MGEPLPPGLRPCGGVALVLACPRQRELRALVERLQRERSDAQVGDLADETAREREEVVGLDRAPPVVQDYALYLPAASIAGP